MSDQDFPSCRWRDDSKPYMVRRHCGAPVPARVGDPETYLVLSLDCARCPAREDRSAKERIIERIEAMMAADGPQAYTRERVLAIVEEELP